MENIPLHIAIIMDGNGRWAEKKRQSRIKGHKKGIEAAREIVNYSSELGIKFLTLYTFSKENWNRPAVEVDMLMGFLEKYLKKEAESMMSRSIRFRAIGSLDDLPRSVRRVVSEIEALTSENTGMVLQLALSYSGRGEIVDACRTLVNEVTQGRLSLDDIDEEAFGNSLYTRGLRDPDLLIRTSGEKRISNFLLWQLAYTELYVTDVLWPDFNREELLMAIRDFQRRERRYGLTGEQLVGVAG